MVSLDALGHTTTQTCTQSPSYVHMYHMHPITIITPPYILHMHTLNTVSLVNNVGETPYDLAVQYRRRACSALLARSMRHVYPPFWYNPTWKHYQHTTENPLWGTEGHFWGSEDTPFSFWGTKGCYKTAPEMCSYNLLRSARDHYRDPDDVMWVELETEAREEEQKRCAIVIPPSPSPCDYTLYLPITHIPTSHTTLHSSHYMHPSTSPSHIHPHLPHHTTCIPLLPHHTHIPSIACTASSDVYLNSRRAFTMRGSDGS